MLTLLTLVLVPFVSAEIIPTPPSVSIDLLEAQTVTRDISIYNNFSFSIFNVTMTELPSGISANMISSIPSKSSATLQITASSSMPVSVSTSGRIYFMIEVDRSDESRTYNINLTREGFVPRDIMIRQGDTLVWLNRDSITHSVTSAIFDSDISPNATFTRLFTDVGAITYRDAYIGYYGSISVMNRTTQQYAYYAPYDVMLPINFNVVMHQTDLQVSVLMNDTITCPIDEGCETLVRVKNIGNSTAKNVTVIGAMPNKDRFDLTPDQETYLVLTINPLISLQPTITTTEQTNKTITHTIGIIALNAPRISREVSIFIPFFEMDGYNMSSNDLASWWKYYDHLCQNFPNSSLCHGEPIIQEVEKVVFKEPEYPYNYSTDDIRNMMIRDTAQTDEIRRISSTQTEMKESDNTQEKTLIEISGRLTNIEAALKDNSDSNNGLKVAGILGVLLLIISAGAYIGISYYKHPSNFHPFNLIKRAKEDK